MAWGICKTCGEATHVSLKRGNKLADYGCRNCGGSLKSKGAGKPGPNKGRKMVRCVICGRNKYKGLRYPGYDFISLSMWPRYKTGPHPAGSAICNGHNINGCKVRVYHRHNGLLYNHPGTYTASAAQPNWGVVLMVSSHVAVERRAEGGWWRRSQNFKHLDGSFDLAMAAANSGVNSFPENK